MRWGRGIGVLGLLCTVACTSIEVHKSTSTLDYLYPKGTPALPPQDVKLAVPVRVALAFSPGEVHSREQSNANMGQLFGAATSRDPLTEVQRTLLLERIATDLRKKDFVKGVDVIPSSYLQPAGSFANLDQIRQAFGSDVVVLLSYDQAQFSNTTDWSLTYWTIVGAWVVKGEENQTQTFVDAVVYDIPSHALLFRAAGTATSGASATPVSTPAVMQQESATGFEAATDNLIAQLDAALKEFGEQARTGLVRGMGTPALNVAAAPDYKGVAKFENGRYTGALGPEALLAAALLLLGAGASRRSARARG